MRSVLVLVLVIAVIIVACFGLVQVSMYAVGYLVRGTRPIPGDASKYDPIAAYPQVAAFAGTDEQSLWIDMKFVKPDGTLDLTADYGAEVTYDFAHLLNAAPTNAAPLGAGGNPAAKYVERAIVTLAKPRTKGTYRDQYYDWGMDRSTVPAAPLTETIASTPTCSLKQLWDTALNQGAPANSLAKIRYDSTGYTFTIDGTKLNLLFDANCQLKNS